MSVRACAGTAQECQDERGERNQKKTRRNKVKGERKEEEGM